MSKFDMPEAMQAARVKLSHKRPYLSTILYRLTPVPTEGIGTLGVDKYARLYFDPNLNWSVEQYATVLYHECCHLLRDHAGRGESMGVTPDNAMAWNICGDAEINDDIEREGGATWPFPPVLPKNLPVPQKDGLFAEEYWNTLPRQKMPGGGGKSQGPGSGKCGGAAGNPADHEEGPPEGSGGVKGATPGIGQAEMDAVKHKVASDIRDAAKTRGDVPGHLQDWAQNILTPKVDWRKVLRSAIRHTLSDIAGMQDYSYKKPGRRQSALPDFVVPTMRQAVPNIAVVVDTSGSMSEDDLAEVLGEVNGVLKQCGQRQGVEAIVCDARVQSVKRVFRAEQIKLAGRGGTDMRLGIQAALERRPYPHAIIVLTDGETPWPDGPTSGVQVIAAIVGGRKTPVPKWITTVYVEK